MDALILYASRSGNTERAAEWIADILQAKGHQTVKHNAQDFHPELLTRFPLILAGCSTIGEGDLLPAFFPWEKALRELTLEGVYGAAFGTGAERYRYFAEAVVILENRLKNAGIKLLLPGLKIDTTLGIRREQVEPWARRITEKIDEILSSGATNRPE